VTRKYPLEPVQRVRAEKADEKARALAEALRAVDASAVLARRRADEQQVQERARRAVAGSEQALLESGGLRVADLAQRSAWGEAALAEQVELTRRRDEAERVLLGARTQADGRRQQLQVAEAEAEVIAKHREGYDAAQQRAALAREEETAEEVHQARRARENKP